MEFLKIASNGQWTLEKSKPMTDEEKKAFAEKRDAYLREKHGMTPKDEGYEKKMAERHKDKNVASTTKPSSGFAADKKYKENYHSATRETAPGKFVHQGMPKKPPADVSPPISKRPEFSGGGFERSPVRIGSTVRKK